MDPSNEMEYLRVKSCKQEILVASEDEYGWNQVKIWDFYFLTVPNQIFRFKYSNV